MSPEKTKKETQITPKKTGALCASFFVLLYFLTFDASAC